MNDQIFVNTYIKILNNTLNEAINKNILLQAQLEVSNEVATTSSSKAAELEAKLSEFNSISESVNTLKHQLNDSNNQLSNKHHHIETFKKELVEARTTIKKLQEENDIKVASLNFEIELLKGKNAELSQKKKRNPPALNTNNESTLESNLVLISDTF
jgi:predicted  nucleic acid-binding Zn-ribbon protein